MQVFVLDYNPKESAKYYVDIHVNKILVEIVQILHSTYYYTNEVTNNTYKLTHKNNPWSKWVRESLDNWKWLYIFGLCLYNEFLHRSDKNTHKSGEILLKSEFPKIKSIGITNFPKSSLPNDLRDDDIVNCYRKFYNRDKRHLFNWKNRNIPYWIEI